MKRFAVPALCLLAFACNSSGSLVQTPPHGRDVFHVAELEPPLGPSEEESCAADPVEDTALAPDDNDGGPDVGVAAFEVFATSQVVVVPQGGSVDMQVEVHRVDGDSEPISITVDGLPAGVSASELSLVGSESAGMITISAPASVGIPRPDLARVRGRSASGSRSAAIRLTVRGPSGSIDSSFGDTGAVRSMIDIYDTEEQPDGKLVFTGWAADEAISVCRLEKTGAPDVSFGSGDGCARLPPDLSGFGRTIAMSPGGDVIVSGDLRSGKIVVARFSASGALDTSFGAGGWVETAVAGSDAFPTDILIGADHKIVIIGGRQAEGFVMGLAADGTLDLDFGINGRIFFGYRSAYHGVRLPDCRLVVTTGNQIEIFSRNGLPANGFGSTDGTGTIFLPGPGLLGHGLANAPNGDLLTSWDGMSVFRISPEGSAVTYPALDPGPSSNGVARNAYTAVIAIAPDGTIVLGGSVSSDDGWMGIGRRLANGTPDESFSPGGMRGFGEGTTSHDLEISRDGRYFLAGTDELYNGVLLRVWN